MELKAKMELLVRLMWAHVYLRLLNFTYLFFGVWNWSKVYCSLWTYSRKFNGLWFRLWVKPQLYTFLIIERVVNPFCLHVCWYRDLIFHLLMLEFVTFCGKHAVFSFNAVKQCIFLIDFVGMLMELWHRLRIQLTKITSKTQWNRSIVLQL